jgi:hypothetical protein
MVVCSGDLELVEAFLDYPQSLAKVGHRKCMKLNASMGREDIGQLWASRGLHGIPIPSSDLHVGSLFQAVRALAPREFLSYFHKTTILLPIQESYLQFMMPFDSAY